MSGNENERKKTDQERWDWEGYDPDPPGRDESDPVFREEIFLYMHSTGMKPSEIVNDPEFKQSYEDWLAKPQLTSAIDCKDPAGNQPIARQMDSTLIPTTGIPENGKKGGRPKGRRKPAKKGGR